MSHLKILTSIDFKSGWGQGDIDFQLFKIRVFLLKFFLDILARNPYEQGIWHELT